MKVGLELEFWVIDHEGVLDTAEKITEKLDFAEREFVKPLLEIKTEPHEEIESLEKEINHKVSEVLKVAEAEGLKICPLGTPLNSSDIPRVSSRRGEIQQEIVGENLEAAKRVAGTHIHFEKENVKNQLNTLTALDPALALLNSSPYYQGQKLGSSSRNQAYRYVCYRDFPEHGQLWGYIDSVEGWEEQIQKRFKEFKKAGEERGVTEEEIERHFSAEDALWTPVRLRYDFPTVEWRSPDTALLTEVIKLVKAVKPVVQQKKHSELPDFKNVKECSQEAIEKGLESDKVREYIEEMGVDPSVFNPVSRRLELPEKIGRKKAREVRLQVAEELTQDLEEAKEMID